MARGRIYSDTGGVTMRCRKDKNSKHYLPFNKMTPWNKTVYVVETITEYGVVIVTGWLKLATLLCTL